MSIATLLLSVIFLSTSTLAIWPIPVSYSSGNTTLWITPDVQIILNGTLQQVGSLTLQQYLSVFDFRANANIVDDQNNVNTNYGDHKLPSLAIVETAITRAKKTLFEQSFVPWKFHPRNSDFELTPGTGEVVKSITLTLNGPVEAANVLKPLAGEVDESYTLGLSFSGAVEITANSTIGISHGLTTFTQLFYAHSAGGHVYTPFVPVEITDSPKFQHRGINMDVARNYFPVADIKRQIEAASFVKMNRFHVHITDGQSWPLEVPALPELSSKGAYRKDLVYTPEDVRDLQLYGAMRGVQVFIEIDMPGHTSSIAFSHPELIASFNKQPDWQTYSAEPPSGTLKLNHSAVPTFLEKLFADLLPRLAPYTAYFHTGGDEVNSNAYLHDETVASNDSAVLQPLMQKFVDRNHDQLRAAGFTPIIWQEMLLQWNVTLGKDVVVQTWRSDEAVLETVQKGHKALVGNYNYWYLDCGSGAWLNFRPGTSSQNAYPYTDYCTPRKSWRLIYSLDPLHAIPPHLIHLVLGGEVHIWAEQTDPVNIDRMVWPRAAAAAEVLWSGAKDPQTGANRSQVEAAPRLSEMRERLVAGGVGAEPIQMVFCLMEGDQCSL